MEADVPIQDLALSLSVCVYNCVCMCDDGNSAQNPIHARHGTSQFKSLSSITVFTHTLFNFLSQLRYHTTEVVLFLLTSQEKSQIEYT